LPVERAGLPGVHESPAEQRHEDAHLDQAEDAQLAERERPRIEEGGVDVEQDEDHADEVELDREALARVADRGHAALVGRALGGGRARPAEQVREREREDAEAEGGGTQDQDRGIAGHEVGVPPKSCKAVSRRTIAFGRTECQSSLYTSATMRRTKIVATVGPASRSPQKLEQLVQAGVNVFRLNFSHGSHDEHLAVITSVREIATRLRKPVALLQDLSGPKIRTGKVKDGVELVNGARITITTEPLVEGDAELISPPHEALPHDVKPGDRVLLDDGNLELRVQRSSGTRVDCEVVDGGPLRSNKGINLPG